MQKIRKQFILDNRKIHQVQKILKTTTETEAVDRALSLVIANSRIAAAHKRVMGRLEIKNMDQSRFDA